MSNAITEAMNLRGRRLANGTEIRPTRFKLGQEVFYFVDVPLGACGDLPATTIQVVHEATIVVVNAIDLRYYIQAWSTDLIDGGYLWVEEAQLFETGEAAEAAMETPE